MTKIKLLRKDGVKYYEHEDFNNKLIGSIALKCSRCLKYNPIADMKLFLRPSKKEDKIMLSIILCRVCYKKDYQALIEKWKTMFNIRDGKFITRLQYGKKMRKD